MANEVYGVINTTKILFEDGSGDVDIDFVGVGADDGCISAAYTPGATAVPRHYIGMARHQFATAPAEDVVRYYLAEHLTLDNNGTPAYAAPGSLAGTKADITDINILLRSCRPIGMLQVPPSASADTEYRSLAFEFWTYAGQFQIGLWNDVADAFTADATEHEISLYRVYDQLQA